MKQIKIIDDKEKISCYSHFIGFIFFVVATVILVYINRDSTTKVVISLIYGLSNAFLFLSSTLYHFFKREENEISIRRKLDHMAIFFMIAGAYTPVCYFRLSGVWRIGIIIIQWVLVFGGLFFKLFYLSTHRYIYTIIYLIMGWIGVVAIRQLLLAMPYIELLFLILGGLSYTIGAIFYILKKPNLRPEFGFHEIFHFSILLGAVFHYVMIYHIFITV